MRYTHYSSNKRRPKGFSLLFYFQATCIDDYSTNMRVMGHLLGWLKNIVIGSRHSSHASVVHNVYGNPLPNILHSTISHYRRTIIIGDVHGCLDELKELLIKSRYDSQTCDLIFVGDLVNKGKYIFVTFLVII